MYISDFNYHKPKSVKEAINLLAKSENGAAIAGGTDILVEIKKGLRNNTDIISLSGINELKTLNEDENFFYIGAGLTHSEIIASEILKKNLSAFQDALTKIGSEQIRNRGTIGGNLCTGASCCDSAPILMAVNAQVEICNADKTRKIPLRDFFLHSHQTALKKGEIITKIIVPKTVAGVGAHYEKFGLREATSISVVSAAVMVKIKDNICVDACIVIGAVAPTPLISISSTKILIGKNISELSENSPVLEQIGIATSNDSLPIDDIRGSAQYRRDILKVITQRAVIKAVISAKNKL